MKFPVLRMAAIVSSLCLHGAASATLINVELTYGAPGLSGTGFITLDDSILTPNAQIGSPLNVNAAFTDFMLTFTGSVFANGSTTFDSTNLGGLILSIGAAGGVGDITGLAFFPFFASAPLNSDNLYLGPNGATGLVICEASVQGPTNFGCGQNPAIAFLLEGVTFSPVVADPDPGVQIPEPPTAAMLALGLLGLLASRRAAAAKR